MTEPTMPCWNKISGRYQIQVESKLEPGRWITLRTLRGDTAEDYIKADEALQNLQKRNPGRFYRMLENKISVLGEE